MDDGKALGLIWQSLLREFQPWFTRGDWVRFVEWVTGTVLCDEEHRTSPDVWGTCTFHESSARSPNRAETVRAHNWVVSPWQPIVGVRFLLKCSSASSIILRFCFTLRLAFRS